MMTFSIGGIRLLDNTVFSDWPRAVIALPVYVIDLNNVHPAFISGQLVHSERSEQAYFEMLEYMTETANSTSRR